MAKKTDELTHLDEHGNVHMVDVGEKAITERIAVASGYISMQRSTLDAIVEDALPKGDVLATARVAGIMAAKKTAELIPMCHQLLLSSVKVAITPEYHGPHATCGLRIEATSKVGGQTGVEMEALTATSIALLTIYDMCKAIDRGMVISGVRLEHKSGGASGVYQRDTKIGA